MYEEREIVPMSEPLKDKMRKELMLLLHCVSSMTEHIESNRDVSVFQDMLIYTACAARDAVATFNEEYRKEQEK